MIIIHFHVRKMILLRTWHVGGYAISKWYSCELFKTIFELSSDYWCCTLTLNHFELSKISWISLKTYYFYNKYGIFCHRSNLLLLGLFCISWAWIRIRCQSLLHLKNIEYNSIRFRVIISDFINARICSLIDYCVIRERIPFKNRIN